MHLLNSHLIYFKAMKIKDFKNIVTLISHVCNKSALPILECLYLKPGKIIVSDLDNWLEIDFAHSSEGFIPFDQIKKFVAALDNDDIIGFSHNKEKANVYLTINGKIEAKFTDSETPDDFPKAKEVFKVLQENYLSRNNIFKINEALGFTSSDQLRPAMNCVSIDEIVAATDGNILFMDKVEGEPFKPMIYSVHRKGSQENPSFEEFTNSVMLSKNTVNFLMKSKETFKVTVASTSEDVRVNNYGSYPNLSGAIIIFEAKGIKLTHRMCDERFPDFRNVVPQFEKINHYEIIVDKAEFEKSVKLAIIQANKITSRVEFAPKAESLNITSNDLDFGHEFNRTIVSKLIPIHNERSTIHILEDGKKEEKPVSMHEIYDKVAFNGKFLLKICKGITSKYVNIQTNESNRASIINGKYLIMPVMLKNY